MYAHLPVFEQIRSNPKVGERHARKPGWNSGTTPCNPNRRAGTPVTTSKGKNEMQTATHGIARVQDSEPLREILELTQRVGA
ncbi:MAG: hypothetical protein V1897_10080 [Pseudomonadota bacterium]